MTETLGPPACVRAAFGAGDGMRPLPGGQGTSWLVGGMVFKPDADPLLQQWLGTKLAAVPQREFRLATPVPTRDGEWVCGGWSATQWLEGAVPDQQTRPRWREIIEAGRAFHQATTELPRPGFLDTRCSWWSSADRMAWAEARPALLPDFAPLVNRLRAVAAPLGAPQVVHCDLTANVLFADGLPPAIIDVSPYWRPTAYAEGVVVADAMCWHGAHASLAAELGVSVEAVVRGLLFRTLTTHQRVLSGLGVDTVEDELRRYRRAADALGV